MKTGAHEEFVGPFVNRVAAEESCASSHQHEGGKMPYRTSVERVSGSSRSLSPGAAGTRPGRCDWTRNCKGFATKRKEIASAVRDDYLGGQIVTTCPYNTSSGGTLLTRRVAHKCSARSLVLGRLKCSRGYYKRALAYSCVRRWLAADSGWY